MESHSLYHVQQPLKAKQKSQYHPLSLKQRGILKKSEETFLTERTRDNKLEKDE